MKISKENQQQRYILDALGSDYMNICVVNVKSRMARLIKTANTAMSEETEEKQVELDYEMMCLQSIEKYVREEEKQKLKEAVELQHVIRELKEHSEYSLLYEVILADGIHEFQLKYLPIKESEEILMGFRMVDSLIIDRNAGELRKERMFLDVLCKDYTSVYYLDLETGMGEVLKVEEKANAAQMDGIENRKTLDYSKEMKAYCDKYVVEADQEFFHQTLKLANIKRRLALSERFVFRFQSKPNLMGYQYFEGQYVRAESEGFDHAALLAFRHIDDIVTAEQKHQKELERTNDILQAISKIYYSIYQIDLERDVYEEISSDSKFYHITGKEGCASVELMELCKSLVVPEYQERILRFFDLSTLADRLKEEETVAEEYLARDGNWHTARFVVKHRDAEGKATNVLYVTGLISEAKRREQNWIAIAEEANRANEAKTDFLRHMSHDIRTPINGILGMIEIADRHKGDVKKLRECREKTLAAMEYLLSLVNNVLDMGKLENDEIVLEQKSFDLIPLLLKQLPVIELQANENGIRYSGGREASTIRHRYLIGSPVHLNRMLMNLAGNAIRYNRKGGSIKIYCEEISSDETTAVYRFVCADTGIGMSEEFQKKAFEPYTQENKGNVTSYHGSGLGLSIVKKIADKMNGTIEMESEEGVGTTISITIPFEIDHETQTKAKSGFDMPLVDVTGKRALLVEDNELNREIAELILEEEGLIVSFAENGKEALEKFEASEPGWYEYIFMDIMMPVMDGLEATRRIRALKRPDAKTVPIFAMTANAFLDDIRQSEEASMNAHLTKPLDVEKIRETIQKFSRRKE